MFRKTIILCSILGIIVGCKSKKEAPKTAVKQATETAPQGLTIPMTYGYDRTLLNEGINPCDDFYEYAAGGWLEQNPRPDTESRWSTFNLLDKENKAKLRNLLNELSSADYAEKGTPAQQTSDLYQGFLHTEMAESLGLDPLKETFAAIDNAKDLRELPQLLATLKQLGITSIFSMYVSIDAKNSQRNALYFGQGGLGLPDRDYYTKQDSASKSILKDYEEYVAKMLTLANVREASKRAKEIVALETLLANNSLTRTESRDPDKTYNEFKFSDFSETYNYFNWKAFIDACNLIKVNTVIVSNPRFYDGLKTILPRTNMETWRAYFKFHTLNNFANVLPDRFFEQNFTFYQTRLSGIKTMKTREERAIDLVNNQLGEPLGQIFVQNYFSESSKEMVSQMVEFLREAFRLRISELEWMSETTKEKALGKLEAFTYKIGYPEKWKDYSEVVIEREHVLKSVSNIAKFRFREMVNKLHEPIDKTEWGMSPQTVNAYYSPSRNEIVFPAGILQPPFFHPNADIALNYGGIGAVIGHEFSHGFDDKGSKYDAEGNLKNWWTDEDRSAFEKKTEAIVNQFNEYEPLPGHRINGALTQGENIADNAGLTMAYIALQLHHQKRGFISEPEDGFNWKQRFFLSWANVWVNHITDAELKKRLVTDSHSPGKYRVNGPLSQLAEFQDAFDCEPKSKMNTQANSPVRIW